jgi:CBS domain-containing protein
MRIVENVLREKGRAVWSVSADATVYAALQLMAEKNVGAVIVLQNGEIAGILSERDYARKVILQGKSSLTTPVSEIMTTQVFYVAPSQTIDECMGLMTSKHIRHLPVMDGGRLVGLVSIGDVVKQTISEQQVVIEQQENYILGRGYGQ